MRRMKWVIGVLRAHLLLILGLRALLAITVILWSLPAWPLAAIAVLQRNLLLIGILGGGLAILVLLWKLPQWQAARPELTPQERFTVENEARKKSGPNCGGRGGPGQPLFHLGGVRSQSRRANYRPIHQGDCPAG
jgi:hypothetical protein